MKIKLSHAVFTNCKLDYSSFSQVRAPGPVIFSRCTLREADFESCHFPQMLFDECDLALTNFGSGSYKGCDLRGNDLSSVRGIHNLKAIVIDRHQLLQLAEAMAAELDVTFGDEGHAE